jgi:FO synthase
MTRTLPLASLRHGTRLNEAAALKLAAHGDLASLMMAAAARRDLAHGDTVSFSPKAFIPLTRLCRDVCHYCVFARPPRSGERAFLTIDEVLAIARTAKAAGCHEALFTLGDKPELRYRAARDELASMGHETTLSYLAKAAEAVLRETRLFPHINAGVMCAGDVVALRKVSISQGLMLETTAERLSEKGGPHFGSPDKAPDLRLASIRAAGEAAVPFTSGLLIGIGETREERIEALLALRDLNDAHGHIQELIIQNFAPKPGTRMANSPSPSPEEHLWTIAAARLIFDPDMNIQAPPNLSAGRLCDLIDAGINDWGGVSPVTPDHVNPEAPWPHFDTLRRETEAASKRLIARLPIYPRYIGDMERWVDSGLRPLLLRAVDGEGWPRIDNWVSGAVVALPAADLAAIRLPQLSHGEIHRVTGKAALGRSLSEAEIVCLFQARGADFAAVCSAADELRTSVNGERATYVITRNINYTNICGLRCQFCAFAKGKTAEHLRGKPYNLPLTEIGELAREAWRRGATEVCMQGGIHPSYTGATYLDIVRTVKAAVPGIHIHAFSPLEVHQGAGTLGVPLDDYLRALKAAGLGSLPGTAAEILDDEVRVLLCPDKIRTDRWLEVMRAAHAAGLRSTATIMFGHIDRYEHWARHLLRVRHLQQETGGFTEMVPLPFVHMEAPIYLKGRARRGPTFREAVLMHAVCRLVLHPVITNIQASWVKMGPDGMQACLQAGANDMGGTLMNETITRSAGASHGQEMTPEMMEAIGRSLGREVRQRGTLYQDIAKVDAVAAA